MAKRDARFPKGHKVVVCVRCGAPANKGRRGGRLKLVTGIQVGTRQNGRKSKHRLRLYEHADPAFCALRIPYAPMRRPQDRNA